MRSKSSPSCQNRCARRPRIPHLLGSVANKLQAALQTENVVIFLRDGRTGDYRRRLCVRIQPGGWPRGRLSARKPPAALCRDAGADCANGRALELDGGDPAFDLAATNGHSRLTNEERQTLLELKSTLLLPLKTKNAMPGVVALGSRLGDLPFSGEDKRLVAIGRRLGVARARKRATGRTHDRKRIRKP